MNTTTIQSDVQFAPGYMFEMGKQVWNVYAPSASPAYRVCVRVAQTWDTAIAHLDHPATLHVSTIAKLPEAK